MDSNSFNSFHYEQTLYPNTLHLIQHPSLIFLLILIRIHTMIIFVNMKIIYGKYFLTQKTMHSNLIIMFLIILFLLMVFLFLLGLSMNMNILNNWKLRRK